MLSLIKNWKAMKGEKLLKNGLKLRKIMEVFLLRNYFMYVIIRFQIFLFRELNIYIISTPVSVISSYQLINKI